MTAALALGGIGLALAGALCLARRALAGKERDNANAVADAVDAVLPQTQCAQCGYPGCRPYARAVAAGERTDLCLPGGADTVAALNRLLGRGGEDAQQLDSPAERVARIDPHDCVGCALCIAACPVDAIAGAPQFLHGVIAEHCTGCELCVPTCPVDCIDLVETASVAAVRRDTTAFAPLPFDADAALANTATSHAAVPSAAAPSAEAIIARIEAAGIVGMGGGGYPTARKIREAAAAGADWVIGNGMGSESATSDHTLLRQHGREVAAGLALVAQALASCAPRGAGEVRRVLAVPRDSGLGAFATEVSPPFPHGDERSLVTQVVGRAVPRDGYPTDVGVVVLNVATLFAVYQAVALGRAPSQRLVTVGGADMWLALGAPLADLPLPGPALRVNGLLTGYDAAPDETVQATTFAVDAPRPPAQACIGCGWCVPVCPEGLSPDRLHRAFAAGGAADGGAGNFRAPDQREAVASCVECGACTATCPSGIDLVGEFRALKRQAGKQQEAHARSSAARLRWTAREQRLVREAEAARTRRAERMRAPRQW